MITLGLRWWERIFGFGVFPSSLISINGARAAVKSLVLIDAKKDAVHAYGASLVLAGSGDRYCGAEPDITLVRGRD